MKNRGITPAALSALTRGDIENFVVASTPGGIEMQEAAGQAAFVGTKSSLPIECPKADLEKLGFVFGEPIDDLFIAVTFPTGWSKKATDHSMWSDLLDDKGRKRAGIFYKAAFYDRKATMHRLTCRYTAQGQYLDDDLKPTLGHATNYRIDVIDNATGQTVFQTEAIDYGDYTPEQNRAMNDLQKEVDGWLDDVYPLHKLSLSYWD